jgi:hypothetical protein
VAQAFWAYDEDMSGRIDSTTERIGIVKGLVMDLGLQANAWTSQAITNACEWPWDDAVEVLNGPLAMEVEGHTFYMNGRYVHRREIGGAWYWDKESSKPAGARCRHVSATCVC